MSKEKCSPKISTYKNVKPATCYTFTTTKAWRLRIKDELGFLHMKKTEIIWKSL